MMDTLLTCKRCEHQGYDVQSRIVEVDDPKAIQYSTLAHPVMERFRREARCIDKEACDDRLYSRKETA